MNDRRTLLLNKFALIVVYLDKFDSSILSPFVPTYRLADGLRGMLYSGVMKDVCGVNN